MKIVDGVYRIRLFPSSVYLVEDEKLILIDTGVPGYTSRILRYIRKMGRNPKDIGFIVLTHYHIDHIGNARRLKHITGGKVVAHEIEAPYIEGKQRAWKDGRIWWTRLLLWIGHMVFKKCFTKVDIKLRDGDKIGNLKAIHVPGHTRGSIALLDERRGIMFPGDTVPYTLAYMRLKKGPNPYSWDVDKECKSFEKLAKFDYELLLPNDSRIVTRRGAEFVRQFVHHMCKSKVDTR